MFKIFGHKKQPKGEVITLKLDGMHCSSCSLNIDGELEDTEGVLSVKTSYPKSETTVEYDSHIVKLPAIKKVIESLGYKVVK